MSGELAGVLSPITRFTGPNKLKLDRALNFTITITPETIETQRRPDCAVGVATTSATITQSTTHTLSYDSPAVDELTISEFFDQQITENNTTAIALPQMGCIAVTTANAPGGSITYTGLTANETVQVNLSTNFTQETLVQVAAAPAAANEFQVSANAVVLDASQVDQGKTATITRTADQTPTKYIGGNAPVNPYGTKEFYGVVQGLGSDDPWHIWYPSCTNSSGARTFGTADTTSTTEYTAGVATSQGFSFPYICWQLPANFVIA